MPRASRDPDDETQRTQSRQLDPARLDVTARPKRKRRKRNVPEPREELKRAAVGMEKRALARPHPPGIILEPAGHDEEHWTTPHSDPDLHLLQLADAFGTRSLAVIRTFMRQLEKLCDRNIWDEQAQQWRLDEHEYSAALAVINSVKPRNELEAMHAAQMVAVHAMALKLSARALKYDYDPKAAAIAGKLAQTFNDQMRVHQEMRGKGRSTRQSIKVSKETHVHQHQHLHDHREGGAVTEGTTHEPRAEAVEERATLRSEEPGGQVLRLPRRSRKAGV